MPKSLHSRRHARFGFAHWSLREAARHDYARLQSCCCWQGSRSSTRWSSSTTSPISIRTTQFVHHVLLMDSTFPGNHGMWRALSSPALHLAFYLSIIAWEIVTTILLWWGVVSSFALLRQPAAAFNAAKRMRSWRSRFPADVARGLSRRGRRVVPDVAVAHMERAGRAVRNFAVVGMVLLFLISARKARRSCDV